MSVTDELTGPGKPSFHLEEMVLNMGPQHPSTHGVLRLVLHLDGELAVSVEPVLGYLHRGFEKLAENRTYLQYLAMLSRLDYLSGSFMEWSYVRSIEALMNIEVPKRAEYIRVIVSELNRIISHEVAIGDFMLNLGGGNPVLLGLPRPRGRHGPAGDGHRPAHDVQLYAGRRRPLGPR